MYIVFLLQRSDLSQNTLIFREHLQFWRRSSAGCDKLKTLQYKTAITITCEHSVQVERLLEVVELRKALHKIPSLSLWQHRRDAFQGPLNNNNNNNVGTNLVSREWKHIFDKPFCCLNADVVREIFLNETSLKSKVILLQNFYYKIVSIWHINMKSYAKLFTPKNLLTFHTDGEWC